MNCIVTAGPTYEPLDDVRRLTNFSTGRLGSELAAFLCARGHTARLLLGEQATYHPEPGSARVERFTTTEDLRVRLQRLAAESRVGAVFHAAAVSDFKFGTVWQRTPAGGLVEVKAGKVSSRLDSLLVELVAAPKIIADLRGWFPQARLVGWKYEVDDGRASVLGKAQRQLAENGMDACVTNGPAYGAGFGVVTAEHALEHCETPELLFVTLEQLLHSQNSKRRTRRRPK